MSAETDALLRRLFAEGALPAEPPALAKGELRFAGQTLSPSVAQLYRSERKRWEQTRRGSRASAWFEPFGTELPPDVSAASLRKQLASLFGIREVRSRAAAARIARAGGMWLLTPLALRVSRRAR